MTAEVDLEPIVEALDDTGVYVDESAADWLSPRELQQLEAEVAAADGQVVVVLTEPVGDSTSAGSDLLFRVHDAGGPDALYLGVDQVRPIDADGGADGPSGPYTDSLELRLAAEQWGTVAGDDDVAFDALLYLDYGDDGAPLPLGQGLADLAGHVADGTVDEAAAQGSAGLDASLSESDSTGRPSAGPEADGGIPVVGLTAVVVLVLAAVAGVVVARRRRRTPEPAGFVLPASVADRVRSASDAGLLRRARADVLALGERIDATELPKSLGTQGRASWQAALDHYEAAARLVPDDARLDGDTAVDVLDVVGAVVLAERGDAALDAAARGRASTPGRPCFLHPLHGAAVAESAIERDGRRVEVPLCRDCRRDVGRGRRPDVLDVEHRGRPEHYFETDREPWASTGFGALDDDLLGRLREARQR